jgi:tetratricopeptide (TPR) repeat protein
MILMRPVSLILAFVIAFGTLVVAETQQSQAADQQPAAAGASSSQLQTPDQSTQPDDAKENDKQPGKMTRLKRHLRDQVSSGCVDAIGNHCWDKPSDRSSDKNGEQAQTASNTPPRSDDKTPRGSSSESSSKSTKVDLSPPAGEVAPPGVGVGPTTDVQEMKPWNPHKADKDVEVGDFYLKRGNYRAAESRYKEALYWQDNHAVAQFRLAQTEEKLGNISEARRYYSAYLKVLPDGEFAVEARKGLDRIKDKTEQTVSTAAK